MHSQMHAPYIQAQISDIVFRQNLDTNSTYLHLHTDLASKVLTGGRAANYQASLRASLQQKKSKQEGLDEVAYNACGS